MPSGITVHSSPTTIEPIPCYNPHWFVATSTNVASTNFKYTIVLTDLLTGNTLTEQVIPNPSNKLEFNAEYFAETYMENYFPKNSYGWKKCVDATRKIRVNIGETYGATPVYVSGSNIDYVTWNAALDVDSFANYSVNDYCYDSTVPAYNYLTSPSRYAYEDRSQFLYVIIQQGNTTDLPDITVKSYDSSGTLLGTSVIARPDYNTGLYTDNYVCIDVGKKGLDGLTAPEVTGTFPVLPANTSYYTISDLNSGGGSAGIIQTITIDCSNYTVYSLHYLNRKGGFSTLHCKLVTELTAEKTVNTYKKNTWTNVSNVMVMDSSEPIEKTQTVSILDKFKLNSDWLTQDEFTEHKDLFSSPLVYLDLGSSTNYTPVKVINNGYVERNSDKLRQLQIDLTKTHNNYRQRG